MTSNDSPSESKYVTLVSSDGFEFIVLREAACKSGAIRRMLDPKSESPPFPHSIAYMHSRSILTGTQASSWNLPLAFVPLKKSSASNSHIHLWTNEVKI